MLFIIIDKPAECVITMINNIIRLLVANRILSGTTTKRQHRDVIQHEVMIHTDIWFTLMADTSHSFTNHYKTKS